MRKGEVPPLTQVSVADFKSGGYFEAHDHEDMFESLRLQTVVFALSFIVNPQKGQLLESCNGNDAKKHRTSGR